MKSILKSVFTTLGLLLVIASFAQKPKTEKFKVYGECGMCKKHIEGAVAKQPGITKATWNSSTKIMTVVYVPTKITMDEIQKKIAAVGYDTPKYRGDDKAYKSLDECCQYERKEPAEEKG